MSVYIDYRKFMNKYGVKKKQTVQNWLNDNLIPGVINGHDIDIVQIPNSAKRPYNCGALKKKLPTNKIYAHMVKALIRGEHIMSTQFHITQLEFNNYIDELEKCNLLIRRTEDGIEYYDSTVKASSWAGKNIKDLASLVITAVSTGVTKAYLDAIN